MLEKDSSALLHRHRWRDGGGVRNNVGLHSGLKHTNDNTLATRFGPKFGQSL